MTRRLNRDAGFDKVPSILAELWRAGGRLVGF